MFAGLLLVTGLHLSALDSQKQITQYIHKKWTTENGLPNNNIYALLQTGDGYLWIGTTDGLARFDGVRFEIFNKNNTAGFPDNRITTLFESSDKSLWIGTRNGLIMFKDGVFNSLTKADGLLHDVVKAFQEDGQGNLWIGYRGDGISLLKNGDLSSMSHPADLSRVAPVRVFLLDKEKNLWAGTRNGLYRFTDGKPEKIGGKTKKSINNYMIRSLIMDDRGNIRAGTEKKGLLLFRFKKGKYTGHTGQPGLQSNWVNTVMHDSTGNTWIGTEGGGLHRLVRGNIAVFTEKEGLSNDSVNCLLEDREGNLWVGTYSGLTLLLDGKFTCYTEKEGLLDNVTWTVYQDSRENIWITTNEGLNCFKQGRFIPYKKENGLSSNFVSSTWEDKQGSLWIGTYDKGLNVYKDGVFSQFGREQGLDSLIIRAVFVDSRGNIWAGSSGRGLFKITEDGGTYKISSISTKNGLSNDHIFVIYEDSKGGIWVGTDGGGLNHIEGDNISLYNKSRGLSSDVIFSILEEKNRPGTLWIGTEDNGLNYCKDGKIVPVTTKNGLSDNTVYQIFEDDRGFFWLGGQKGISRVQKKELQDFTAGKINRVKTTLFGKTDGLKGDECNGGFQPAGWRTTDGKIWFPTPRGLVAVDPGNIKMNTLPPPVRIEKILVNSKVQFTSASSHLTLKPGSRKVEFHYTALSLSEPRKVQFKYILEGFEEEWVFSGNRKDRIATYTNIPPGEYTFRVTACNNDGTWNEEGVSLNLSVLYPLWQRWWFILLGLIVFSLLSYFIVSALKNLYKLMNFWKNKNYIGKYRIIGQIGQGGMANIFKANHGKNRKKKDLCALKLMRDEYIFNAVYRSRFLNEGEIIDKIDHPHIVKVFERGEHNNNLFIAMELVDGSTLAELIEQKGPLPVGDCLDIMMQLCDALAVIHRAGIIHRDLKPANIMLVKKGDNDKFVKLLDFGLAKTRSLSRVTETGMAVGTLNYLSPEQIMDSTYSTASDIYAAGVIFYEMLTGERPYKGETPIEMIQAIFKNEVKEPKRLITNIPGKLNEILLTMIDKNPENRPSAEVLKIILQKLKPKKLLFRN